MSEPQGAPQLRLMILASKPADLGLAPTTELPHVWAALMEMRVRDALVTLVAVADGATSLYFGTGGGIIGGQSLETVRDANHKFLVGVEKFFDAKAFVARDKPLDTIVGAVSFAALTYDGLAVARDAEDRLTSKKSPVWPLYYLGQQVITALRTSVEGKPAG